MNFTKNNMNKNIVTYLDRDMEVKNISERDFIKEFEDNIKKLFIELFHIYKDNLKYEDLLEYMKSFLLYYDTLQEKKINHIELKEQLKSIMDIVFRDEDVNEVIKNIKLNLQNNNKVKNKNIKNNASRIKKQKIALNEYYNPPENNNEDNKNLYNLKNKAFKENIKDKKKYKNIDEDYEENEEDNKDKLITKKIEKLIEEENKKNEILELESKKNEILELKSKNNTIIKKKKIKIVSED